MARIITFASGKGGVGKTTVVANLGTALGQLGKRVTLLDGDVTMANLSLLLGLEKCKVTLHEVLAGEAKLSRAIYQGPKNVKIAAPGISLNGIRKAKLERMRGVISELAKKTELLLIDAPSGLEQDAIIALSMAQEVVLIVNPDIASISNALKTKIVAERLHVKPRGVVITRVSDRHIDLSEEEISSVLEVPVLVTIPENPEVRRAAAFGEPVVLRKPKSNAAAAFRKLATILLKAEHETEANGSA